jgi:hypothetical protein
MHHDDDLDTAGHEFYRAALLLLLDENVPFLVGGAYALEVHTGIIRRTKDFDIFMLEEHVDHALKILDRAGYNTELTFPHWLAKAFSGDDFIDIIFNSGNGICRVDELWFHHAIEGKVLGLDLRLCPAEETIWQKSFILERDRCDVADVAHYFRHRGNRLDWHRLIDRFAHRWRVLLAQVVLFDFIYPSHRASIPIWVRTELATRMLAENQNGEQHGADCHGTLLSATQYLRDVDLEGYRDGRLPPLGTMSRHDVAVWTANFLKPK